MNCLGARKAEIERAYIVTSHFKPVQLSERMVLKQLLEAGETQQSISQSFFETRVAVVNLHVMAFALEQLEVPEAINFNIDYWKYARASLLGLSTISTEPSPNSAVRYFDYTNPNFQSLQTEMGMVSRINKIPKLWADIKVCYCCMLQL